MPCPNQACHRLCPTPGRGCQLSPLLSLYWCPRLNWARRPHKQAQASRNEWLRHSSPSLMLGMRGADLGLHGDVLGLNGDLLCSDGRRRERDLSRGGDSVFFIYCLHHQCGHGQKVAVAMSVSLHVLHGLQLGVWRKRRRRSRDEEPRGLPLCPSATCCCGKTCIGRLAGA